MISISMLNDTKTQLQLAYQNIDFQTTILSRFDMIFIVKDEHNETRDKVYFWGYHTPCNTDSCLIPPGTC
jgi:hypothetical protein